MKLSPQSLLMSILFIILLLICHYASGVVLTFLIAFLVAYILKGIARILSQYFNMQYLYCASFVYICFAATFALSIVLIIPLCIAQINDLIHKFPAFQAVLLYDLMPKLLDSIKFYFGENAFIYMNDMITNFRISYKNAGDAVDIALQYASFTANLLFMILLFPVVLFFFLIDFPTIERDFRWLITKIGFKKMNSILDEIYILIFGFLLASFKVMILTSIYYVIALNLIGFEYALLFGVLFGCSIIIPFVGAAITIISCIGVSFLNNGFGIEQIWILGIFFLAQIIENMLLYPKIIGDTLGIHPLTIIFSILVLGEFFGIMGVLLAVPLVGVVKIVCKKLILELDSKN